MLFSCHHVTVTIETGGEVRRLCFQEFGVISTNNQIRPRNSLKPAENCNTQTDTLQRAEHKIKVIIAL